MEAINDENKINELKYWAKEVMELLDEVKPYRSIFYKQRVAKLKSEFSEITGMNQDVRIRMQERV